VDVLFERSVADCKAFLVQLYGDDDLDTPLPPGTEFEYSPPSVLRLSFPENYTWQLQFAEYECGHLLYHPEVSPEGRLIAGESAHYHLPGLRWAELKQMVACCLPPGWAETFDSHTLYPLLYPIADPVTLSEYDEVRQMLRAAGDALQIVPPAQLEPWLDATITVYDQGRVLHFDAAQGWYDPAERYAQDPKVIQTRRTVQEGDLWLPDPAGGWYTNWPWSLRRDARSFAPFFAMLDRQTQLHP
jgi:hypothetical protein